MAKLIVGNWKMNPTALKSAVTLGQGIREKLGVDGIPGGVTVGLAPPACYLHAVGQCVEGSPVRLGAQNICWEDEGAFTGEISPTMLKDVGGSFTIVGHSERRALFRETDDIINKRLKHAIASGLEVILCVGETLPQREKGITKMIVEEQLRGSLLGLEPADFERIIIAYEPVWAIGTGVNAQSAQIAEAHAQIREYLEAGFGVGQDLRILYGGSVKPENAADIYATVGVDGALVGGASLQVESFTTLVELAS
ncbi:MAG: triose-phosphate isomerase [Chrysiogenetes bacterium]|nr:triose-phosphate isomerase [Chrysiogenetes bacterium]